MILSQSLSPLSLFFFTSVFRRIPILFKLVPWPKQTHIHNQPSQPTPTPPHTSLRISQISILHDRGKPETHPGNEREDISGEKKRNRCDHCHCIDGESEYSPLTPRLLRFPIPYGSRSLLVFSLPCLSPFLSLNLVFSLFSSFRHCDAQSLHPPRSRWAIPKEHTYAIYRPRHLYTTTHYARRQRQRRRPPPAPTLPAVLQNASSVTARLLS